MNLRCIGSDDLQSLTLSTDLCADYVQTLGLSRLLHPKHLSQRQPLLR